MFNQIFGHPMAQSSWHKKLIYTHWFSSYLILWLTPVFYCILSKAIFAWPLSPWGLSRRLSSKKICLPSRRHRFDLWVGKIPWRRKWQPTPVFLPGKSHRQRSLAGCSPWSHKKVGHNLVTKQKYLLGGACHLLKFSDTNCLESLISTNKLWLCKLSYAFTVRVGAIYIQK